MTPRRVYRVLLRVYPRGFRTEYGAEMEEAFLSLHKEVAARGRGSAARLWIKVTVDTVASGLAERLAGPGLKWRRPSSVAHALNLQWESNLGEAVMNGWQRLLGAFKSLSRAPGYAFAFILTLGLAIGVNSSVFSVIDGVLLEPLPFQDADRILYVQQPAARAGVENSMFSFMEIDDYRNQSQAVDEFVEFGDWVFSVVGEGDPHRAVAGLVTSNYFDVLGIVPMVGRVLNVEDDLQGADPVIVLTHEYWTRAFGSAADVEGRTVQLSGKTARIVGVLEPGMHYTGTRRPSFYANYATNDHYLGAAMRDARSHRMTDLFARLAPGAETVQVQNELTAISSRLHQEYPTDYPEQLGMQVSVTGWQEQLTKEARPTFVLLMATVGLVLLLACANVTNLTLARLIRREGEMATRGALGATGRDLRLQLTSEHVLLALAGCGLGILLALLSRGALVAYASRFTVRAQEVGVDFTVLLATLTGGIAVAVAMAWLPGLPVNPGPAAVASGSTRTTHSRLRRRIQRGLVISQLALSFSLLAGAGLLVRSLLKLNAVHTGFRTENVLTLRIPPDLFSGAEERELFEEVLHRVGTFPGVQGVAAAGWVPLNAPNPVAWQVRLDGDEASAGLSNPTSINSVTPEYFDVLDVTLLEGRLFGHMDMMADNEGEVGIVINESMARTLFGGESAIGRTISRSFSGQNWQPEERIIGVVADGREFGLDRAGVHVVYVPASRAVYGPSLLIASEGDAQPLARFVTDVIHKIDPTRPVEEFRTLDELKAESVAPSRLNATLFGAFAVLALAIAAVGVLGVLAFSVSQRIREFGVRMALGADRARVLRGVMTEGVIMIGLALALGGVGVLVIGRFLSQLLFAVDPVDALTVGVSAGVLTAVAIAAALLPAFRATRVQPSEALRHE